MKKTRAALLATSIAMVAIGGYDGIDNVKKTSLSTAYQAFLDVASMVLGVAGASYVVGTALIDRRRRARNITPSLQG